jgi:hypothetical protein
MVCVLAGAGWVLAVRMAHARFGRRAGAGAAVALALLAAPFVYAESEDFRHSLKNVRSEADFYDNFDAALAKSGGAAVANRCGVVVTGPYQVQAIAWRLHRHGKDVLLFGEPPGTVFAPRYNPLSRDPDFPKLTETTKWIVRRRCSR